MFEITEIGDNLFSYYALNEYIWKNLSTTS